MIFAIRYGFRMQCGVHTTTSSQVMSELSILFVITPGQNLQVNRDLSSTANYTQALRKHIARSMVTTGNNGWELTEV